MSEYASTLLGGWSRNNTLVTVRFMLGRPANDSASGDRQRALVEEQADHGDLVQLDFVDSYRNLTLKGVAAMQWLTDYCASTRYEPNIRRRLSVSILTLRAKLSGAVHCYRSCLFATGGRCFVDLLPQQLEIACIDLHQTGSVGEGSDELQQFKVWPSCTPRKGICGGAKIFGSALNKASAQCLRLSERMFYLTHFYWVT